MLVVLMQELQQDDQQGLIQQLKSQCSSMAAVLPFASTTVIKASSSSQAEIYYGLAKAVDVSAACGSVVFGFTGSNLPVVLAVGIDMHCTEQRGAGAIHCVLISHLRPLHSGFLP